MALRCAEASLRKQPIWHTRLCARVCVCVCLCVCVRVCACVCVCVDRSCEEAAYQYCEAIYQSGEQKDIYEVRYTHSTFTFSYGYVGSEGNLRVLQVLTSNTRTLMRCQGLLQICFTRTTGVVTNTTCTQVLLDQFVKAPPAVGTDKK